MKKLLVILLFCLLSIGLMADIMSTTIGGNWANSSTWIGGVVPNQNSDVIIQGNVFVSATFECNNLSIQSAGTITSGYNDVGQVTVYGNCSNNGQLVDNGATGELRLVVLGNITNNNLITCEYVYFAGVVDHTFSSIGYFSPSQFLNMDVATVTFLSNVSLDGTHISLPHLNLNGGFQSQLSLNGGFMDYTNILGSYGSVLNLDGGAHITNVTADVIVTMGTVLISGPVFIGNLYNNGNIYNRSDADNGLGITYRLDNHGIIGDNPGGHYLNLSVGGDIYDYHTLNPQYLFMGSDTLHYIQQSSGASPISAANIINNGDYRMLSNLSFTNCSIAWNSHDLIMHNGNNGFNLNLDGGSLTAAYIEGKQQSTLNLSNNAHLIAITADQICFNGTVQIGDGMEIGSLVNNGSLRVMSDYPHTMSILESLTNYGTIADAASGNFLHVNLWGNLVNLGQITNYQFTLYGNDDQSVLKGSDSNIYCAGGFRLYSNLGYTEWYFNGQPTNGQISDLRTVDPSISGVWNPSYYGIYGRNIIFGSASGALNPPQSVSAVVHNGNLRLQWTQVSQAIYYTVWSASSPDGDYTALATKVFDHNLGDGLVMTDLPFDAIRRFYRITTGN